MRTVLIVLLAIGLSSFVAPSAAADTAYCPMGDMECWVECQTHVLVGKVKGGDHDCRWAVGPPP